MSTTLLKNAELLSLLSRYRRELSATRREREFAMRALGESQRQLSETQTRARIGTWERWLDSEEIFWSDQVYRIFGLEPGEEQPSIDLVLKLVHPGDIDRVRDVLSVALTERHGFSIDYRIVRRDGTIRVVRTENRLELDANQQPERLIGTIEDISADQEPETHLIRSPLAPDSDHVSWFEWEVGSECVTWSNEVYRIFGRNPETFTPTYGAYMSCIHPDDREALETEITDVLDKERPLSVEHRIIMPNGEIRTILCSGEILDETGRCKRLLGTVQDITVRKMAQDRLRESELRYRALFEEMKRTNEQLTFMSRRLSSVQEEERRRISLELHDEVGGQLSALQLAIQLIDVGRDDVGERISNAEKLTDNLIEQIRSISRKLRPSSLDRLGLTATLSGLMSQVERLYHLKLSADIDITDERVINQETQIAIYRIVQEALTNVTRHAESSEARVIVRQAIDEIEIRITDEGVGLGNDARHLIDDSIGLSGMKERATMLGGTFTIGSGEKNGTEVHVKLPLLCP